MKPQEFLVLRAKCDKCEASEQAGYPIDDATALQSFRAWLVWLGWMVGEIALCVECHAEARKLQQTKGTMP